MAIVRNFFAGIGCLTVLAALGVVGWFYRADIEDWVRARRGGDIVMVAPSPELAAKVEETFRELAEGRGDRETRLTETELQSYVQYRLVDRLPAGVERPAVDLRDSTVAFSAMLDFRRLQVEGTAVEGLRRMMGDSAQVSGEVYPTMTAPGRGRVHIVSLQAGLFPVPPMLIGTAAQGLGLQTEGQAVLLDVPEDVIEVRVENEEIVLIRDR